MAGNDDKSGPGFDAEPIGPAVEQAKSDVLKDVWRPLGTWPAERPTPRQWLVTLTESGETKPKGVLPLGKVGLLAGAGGSGKSWATTQLAVAVAAGVQWLGFDVATPGRVLLVLGEEEQEEVTRRLHNIGEVMCLTPEQQRRAADRLVVLPMAGRDVALTKALDEVNEGELPETALAREIERRLKEGGEWRLVVLDPLSRFAGADVEVDNAAATRFVQVLERLVSVPGTPTILVTHHTNKTSRTGQAQHSTDAGAATALRGSSALTDGVRWQANLTGRPRYPGAPRLIDMAVVKTNYGPPLEPILLTAPNEGHGSLRGATGEELAEWKTADERAKVAAKREKKRTDALARDRDDDGKFAPDEDADDAFPGEQLL